MRCVFILIMVLFDFLDFFLGNIFCYKGRFDVEYIMNMFFRIWFLNNKFIMNVSFINGIILCCINLSGIKKFFFNYCKNFYYFS